MIRSTSTVRKLLARAMDIPLLDAQLILGSVLGCSRSWIIAHNNDFVCKKAEKQFRCKVKRRISGEPIAYILGYQEFWSRNFEVDQTTLIPRPETESLVELALEQIPNKPITVLDLGTGCGAIGITLASERCNWTVIANDLSAPALKVAQKNAHTIPNIAFFQGNWCEAIKPNSMNLIICNPPYIEYGDNHLRSLRYEPLEALVSSDSGLSDLREVIKESRKLLVEDGILALEHGYRQRNKVCQMLVDYGYRNFQTFDDLGGRPRTILARIK